MYKQLPPIVQDPIFKIADACQKDTREEKVNLAIGVYLDNDGKVPLPLSVQKAEAWLAEQHIPRAYIGMEGLPAFNQHVQKLYFGEQSPAYIDGRIATVQTLGGTGAISLGAGLLHKAFPEAQAWIGKPGWDNHFALFEAMGIKTHAYDYYSHEKGLLFDEMVSLFKTLNKGSIVLLQPCCHNPTGCDLNTDQWSIVLDIIKDRQLIPFLDIAYLGFGEGLTQDRQVVQQFLNANIPFLLASSFSKNVGLYAERIGALSVVCPQACEIDQVRSYLRVLVRSHYSTPPAHGAFIVNTIFSDTDLTTLWQNEVDQMRMRIQAMRTRTHEILKERVPNFNADLLITQKGMFSYLPLNSEQINVLREKYAIYMLENGRINVPGLNTHNVDYFANALAKVL
ncbi:hypothetical protein IX83_08340 [Basilea psittacipulmonis DSM 24701]|uniref:Aminotransferase n=2 Tax=Basilea TaxID=1472344 RepID=A0A077DGP9_9BURK|nr:hypothetical protein IX83_08340 [Basilea psittacipulmonis DSM 24701]